ncbi:hypothetical protein HJC23_000568 [Cyclotella cryptica]|uniref:RAP domain-containing protein n=1 Tax=Cyclotella cryptica TaxID=29204 RepID=A0ABD3PTL3_9STRA
MRAIISNFKRRRLLSLDSNLAGKPVYVAILYIALFSLHVRRLDVEALLFHSPPMMWNYRPRGLGNQKSFKPQRIQCHNDSFMLKSPRLSSLHSTNAANLSTNESNNARRYRESKKRNVNNKRMPSTNNSFRHPWDADFCTSLRTQAKIQSAASTTKGYLDTVQHANVILQTLLNSPPTECNAANMVCALTLSAKTLGEKRIRGAKVKVSDEFEQSLSEALGILQMLVDDQKLSPRQLCNAAWAVAKHVEYEESIFSRKAGKIVFVNDDGKRYSTWDTRKQHLDVGTEKLIDQLFDSMALSMIDHLEMIRSKYWRDKKTVQTGELCMLLWAYASSKPRDRPPGWEQPRRIERFFTDADKLTNVKCGNNNSQKGDLVTFLHLCTETSERSTVLAVEESDSGSSPESITSRLFDSAAIAFCRGEGAAVLELSVNSSMPMLRNCAWNELSSVAWSFATRGACGTKESDAMMTFLAREATRRLKLALQAPPILTGGKRNQYCKVLPRDVVQIAWALGTMESDNVSVGNALVYLVDAINNYWIAHNESTEKYRQLRYWKCADLVQLASALAHGRLDNRSVLTAIYDESLRRLRSEQTCFSTSELSILLWVQARLNLTEKYGSVFGEFPVALCREVLNRMKTHAKAGSEAFSSLFSMQMIGLQSQEQANLAWSFTILQNYNDDIILLLQTIFHAASSQTEGSIQLEHAHQLWQAYFILSSDCPDAIKFVPREFSEYLEQKWKIEKGRRKRSSSRHRIISRTLELMRVAHRNEYKEDVDVAIVLDDDTSFTHKAQKQISEHDEERARLKIAVEFDGPHHFTAMASTRDDLELIEKGAKIVPRVLGHTVLKYRMLKKKGWTVVRIPYFEFDKIPHWASMERQRYLQRCLKTHKEIRFSGVDVSEYQAIPQTRHSRFD